VTKPLEPPSTALPLLPIETVRDLLGIVRALYAFQLSRGNHGHARELKRAGTQLREALALAIRKGDAADTTRAWRLAEDAIATIARVHGAHGDDLTLTVRLASERVQRRRFVGSDREARRQARIKRG